MAGLTQGIPVLTLCTLMPGTLAPGTQMPGTLRDGIRASGQVLHELGQKGGAFGRANQVEQPLKAALVEPQGKRGALHNAKFA